MDIKFSNDKHFEERLVQAFIVDHPFAEQMVEVLDLNYFNIEHLKATAKIIFDYYQNYKTFPSFQLLVHMVKNELKDEILREKIIAFFIKIQKTPLNGDLEYIKEASLDFCKKRKLALALETSLNFIEERKFDEISHVIQKALQAGSEKDVGHWFLNDFEKRMAIVNRQPVATPWPELNLLLRGGGIAGGELAVICAPTGVGKSHALVDIGADAVINGLNVLHVSLELSEIDIGNRYDARFSGVITENLRDNKDVVKQAIDQLKGQLVIKSYPVSGASAQTLKNLLYKLKLKDFTPNVLIIDYADLMKSSKGYEQRRFEEENVYREVRALSQEINIPIWTATQTNRSGVDEKVLTLKHVAESFAKAQISDLFMTMMREKENSATTMGCFYLAKSRLGRDGIRMPIIVNTSISKIEVLSPQSFDEEAEEENKEKSLKARFKQYLNKDENN
jgi:replicative DNA helicase